MHKLTPNIQILGSLTFGKLFRKDYEIKLEEWLLQEGHFLHTISCKSFTISRRELRLNIVDLKQI